MNNNCNAKIDFFLLPEVQRLVHLCPTAFSSAHHVSKEGNVYHAEHTLTLNLLMVATSNHSADVPMLLSFFISNKFKFN